MPKLCDGTLVINRHQLSRPEPEEPGADIDEGLGDLEVPEKASIQLQWLLSCRQASTLALTLLPA